MIVVIDNYDSFTYNLVQYLGELGAELQVFRNDQVTVEEIEALHPTRIVISPGPGTPEDGGISNDVIRHFHKRVPILGVCLGHQCMGHVFGGQVVRAPRLMHGKTSLIHRSDHPVFEGVPDQFRATRYHSLIVEEPLPEMLMPIAWSEEGDLMGLCHRNHPVIGLQFHPESILTGEGKRILQNFLEMPSSLSPSAPSASRGAAEGMGVEEAKRCPELVEGMDIKEAIGKVMSGEDLLGKEAEAVMGQIMAGEATPAQIGAFLTALRLKGETVEEITGCARAMRRNAIPVRPQRRDLVDTCGTGGDRTGTFNISTTAAFVVAGAGLGVAKHGNRSVSSHCGSADVLEALGINLELTPQQVAHCIDEVGIGFLFAPRLHPAMKHAIGPRREMGVRTIFNILGPLTNPAGATRQIMGVYDPNLTGPLAQVLGKLGAQAAFVVHGADGLDELSTTGTNRVSHLRDGWVKDFWLDPAELGLPGARLEDLRGGTAEENAQITQAILAGEQGPRRDVVLLNAAAALVAGGTAGDFEEGLQQAAEAIDSGSAREKLEGLVAFSQAQLDIGD
jgi:anthranilate synthase/phosphoribosyltransferase